MKLKTKYSIENNMVKYYTCLDSKIDIYTNMAGVYYFVDTEEEGVIAKLTGDILIYGKDK